ncbi:MAG: hypothetical protein RLW62_07305 [Gammaproteobacteria bacterium]
MLVLAVLLALPAAAAPPLRALVVTIVAQEDFLAWLVADAVAAGTIAPLAIATAHVRELATRLDTAPYDVVIAHAHARPAQSLAARGVLAPGTPVFANPRAIIGPADDPAGLRGAPDLADALARLAAGGACWIRHEHGGLTDLQPAAGADDACVIAPAAPGPGGALDAARNHRAYTLWGYHPFMRRAPQGLAAIVTGDARLLATLVAWPVASSPRRAEVDAFIALLAAPATQTRLTRFRLADDHANQAWWPAAAGARPP